ncbi:hypothetical protein BGZ98_001886 [Dissophora globulifera]|nr:hypothetical protein BGZ98_001886 [Dissophora globulifera]
MAEKRKEVRYIAQKFANAILADASPYVISTDGLQALNAFLDELLFILIDTAKGLETNRIKASVYQTFPTALGKNSIVEAELEAKSYVDMGGKDTRGNMGDAGTSAIFNADSDETRVEQVFEQFRAKCQYYSKLGERLGSPAGNPNNAIVVPTLIAIYVTAVLEHVAEYVLQAASTIADRQDHADMVTVREVYVALQEDRQIEKIFETMILKNQLQKRFRNSLIMPGGFKTDDQTPATVKRSGSWGKQLRLGNADKPKLDVQLPTDYDESDVIVDPNRPQFGDWDMPPDSENKLKKKNDFEMLFSSGETMKVSLTPNRLRTIEVHKKAAGPSGAVAARSSSRAASVLGGKEGKAHGRKPSGGANGASTGARKNSQSSESNPPVPPNVLTMPSVPAIPANFGAGQPAAKKSGQSTITIQEPPLSPMQQQQLRQQQQQQSTWNQSQEYHGLGIADNAAPVSPTGPRGPGSPTMGRGDGSLKATQQATNELVQYLGGSSPKAPYTEQAGLPEPPMTPTSESAKKENPIKSFMGRLGRNSIQRTSIDGNSASSPTSIRSFTITGGVITQQHQQSGSGTGSASGSTNGSVYSGHSGQTTLVAPISTPTAPYQLERQGSGQNTYEAVQYQQQQQQFQQQQQQQFQQQQQQQQQQHFQPPAPTTPNRTLVHDSRELPPTPDNSGVRGMSSPNVDSSTASAAVSPVPYPRPVNAETNGIPIPSRNVSLNHEGASPSKANITGAYDTRTVLDAGIPRPLSPRPASPRSSSPRPSSPRSHSPLQSPQHSYSRSPLDGQTPPTPGSIIAPSPLSYSISGSNVSPSSSSTSLIIHGKVNQIQDRLSKTIQPPLHGFKPQDHLHNNPNRISLEGTIRANPFYQQDRNSSVRSSLADLSSLAGSAHNSGEISIPGSKVGSNSSPADTVETSSTLALASVPENVDGAAAAEPTSSDSEIDEDRDERGNKKNRDGMVSPATSPEIGTLKDRLPSATTRTLTAAAVAAKQQQQQLQYEADSQESGMTSPTTKRSSMASINGATNRQFQVYGEQKPAVTAQEEEEEDEEEEEVPYTPVVRRASSRSNRHSIFVDEDAQAMDALSRARHRQSLRLQGDDDHEDDDEDDDDEDYELNGVEPPQKWHYSDEEDEDEDEDEEDEDEEAAGNGERRRRKHESFMSAKSVLLHNSSSVSLGLHGGHDTQDEDEDEDEGLEDENQPKQRQSRRQESSGSMDAKMDFSSLNQDLAPSDFVKGSEYDELVPAVDSEDDDGNGEDEDESEDSDDLEDNDDEEGQDRRIYLQQLRAKAREERRQARLAAGESGDGVKRSKSKKAAAATAEALAALTSGSNGVTRKRTLKKGHSKENLRSQQDRPQTPTTPVPTTQVIPLTPTDLVLIRQKLFAAGNFEASMRMLDTIFHAAMAKMVEGRERGVQTEPVSVLGDDRAVAQSATDVQETANASTSTGEAVTSKTVSTSTSTSTSTATATYVDPNQPQKQLQWVTVPSAAAVAPPVEDDDDEDRVVEWLLSGW